MAKSRTKQTKAFPVAPEKPAPKETALRARKGVPAKGKERPDLYVGLVCAAGTDLTDTKNQLRAQLSVVNYKFEEIKVSDLIADLVGVPSTSDEYSRIKQLMAAGDLLREHSDEGEGVGAAIIAEIRRRRGGSHLPSSTAYVIDSLKNPAEIKLLDQIYGRNYYTVSVFLPTEDRTNNLKNKIAHGRHEPPGNAHRALAEELISTDERGAGTRAQNVQDSFHRADFFVNGAEETSAQIKRLIELVFGEPFTTPTPDEFSMFVAKAAAQRSCDLSRQVGAAIVDTQGSVVATGCNEVPYPGGSIYFEGRTDGIGDNRDKTEGHDPNAVEIQRTLIELITLLQDTGYVRKRVKAPAVAEALLYGGHRELLKDARIRNLIEFGRVVHAEMHALSQAALVGRAVDGATLYCTTFPCHGCARHLIAAGIHEVVFIEPYPKSLTEQLYGHEIEIANCPLRDDERHPLLKVRFRPFHGVAPKLYQRVFQYRPRKDAYGTIVKWQPKRATPVGAVFGVERQSVEIAASNSVAETLNRIRVKKIGTKKGARRGAAISKTANSKRST